MVPRRTGTELGIRDVDEVRAAGEPAERFPGLDVCFHVCGVAVENLVVNRDRAVGGEGERKEDLPEVGTVVLVVPVRHLHRGLASLFAAVAGPVLTRDGQRRGVVVKPAQIDLESYFPHFSRAIS